MSKNRGFSIFHSGMFGFDAAPAHSVLIYLFKLQNRAPFALNTTVRCAAIAIIFQFPIGLIAFVAYNMFLSLFIECIWYAEAFMSDIKLSFDGVDRLATNGESEHSMLGLCRKAIELHIKAYAYDFISSVFSDITSSDKFFRFSAS